MQWGTGSKAGTLPPGPPDAAVLRRPTVDEQKRTSRPLHNGRVGLYLRRFGLCSLRADSHRRNAFSAFAECTMPRQHSCKLQEFYMPERVVKNDAKAP
jgi:hypothetical protein